MVESRLAGPRPSVLVIDDQDEVRDVLVDFLAALGYTAIPRRMAQQG